MKKGIAILSAVLLGVSLTACGSNTNQAKENSSLKAENSSLKAKRPHQNLSKFNDSEYALAAYLKLQGQSATDLQKNIDNMHWSANGNKYSIDFGAHTTTMTVNKDNVEVTYDGMEGDHMGSGNGHKTYSKAKLYKLIKEQRNDIDSILKSHQNNSQNQNTAQSTQTSNTNTQSQSNDPESVALAKGFHDVAGHSAAEWSQWGDAEEAVNSPANVARYQQEHGGNN